MIIEVKLELITKPLLFSQSFFFFPFHFWFVPFPAWSAQDREEEASGLLPLPPPFAQRRPSPSNSRSGGEGGRQRRRRPEQQRRGRAGMNGGAGGAGVVVGPCSPPPSPLLLPPAVARPSRGGDWGRSRPQRQSLQPKEVRRAAAPSPPTPLLPSTVRIKGFPERHEALNALVKPQ
ncbi:hypothetical protein Taro_038999 [Colocasia esculenta]|uniref:Uncharacterized protein n=1 Tax=Colocasia esculenta TaxID=4460 RepID=A0A843WEF8_COLES|nr:hypothetical protein [Colocasia esculenta]